MRHCCDLLPLLADCRDSDAVYSGPVGPEIVFNEVPEEALVWAEEYRHDHRETGPWHYIDIPLEDSKMDLARDRPNGDCVIAKTEQFLGVLKDLKADKDSKTEALRFAIHFVGDLYQPPLDEENGDKGGTERHVTFEGHPDSLHGVWDTSLLGEINRNPMALAAELESRLTPCDKAE